MKTYAEKLKDPRWQRKRLEVMERDDFTCRSCHSSKNSLNVHHAYYMPRWNPWDYDNSALITLCEKCHDEITNRLPKLLLLNMTPEDVMCNTELLKNIKDGDKTGLVSELAYGLTLKNDELVNVLQPVMDEIGWIINWAKSGKAGQKTGMSAFDQLIADAPESPELPPTPEPAPWITP